MAVLVLGSLLAVSVGAMQVLKAYDAPDPRITGETDHRTFHLRIFDDAGKLMWSSWPDENGTLAARYGSIGAVEAEAPINSTWDKYPEVLKDLLPTIQEAPSGTHFRLLDVKLRAASPERVLLPKVVAIPVEGVMERLEAERLFAGAAHGLTVKFAGFIPAQVLDEGADSVRYRFTLDQPVEVPVRLTRGLILQAAPTGSGTIEFRLNSPQGVFTVYEPCNAAPNVLLEPGAYVLKGIDEEGILLDRFGNGLDLFLNAKTVTLDFTYFD